MASAATTKGRVGFLIIFALGSGLFAVHLVHAVAEGESFLTFVLGIFVPMVLAIGILLGGGWLYYDDVPGGNVLRVALWCVGGAGVLVVGAFLTVWYQQVEGVRMADRVFVLANGASGGAVAGFIVGIYHSRQLLAKRQVDQLNQQLSVLNRVLRHDIRNGANVIQGQADILAEQATDVGHTERIRRQAADLVELGEHARTIEELLQDPNAEREAVDVAPLIQNHLDRIQREHPSVEVRSSIPEAVCVYAHPLVGTAIGNVLDNAVEHNDKETPRIDVECDRHGDAGIERIELRIADNGPGLPANEIAVLERGYETPLEHTSGLGLWLVNWIVTASNGDVWFETNSPEGSVVSLQFDAVEQDRMERPIRSG